jgi:hypothetical protein
MESSIKKVEDSDTQKSLPEGLLLSKDISLDSIPKAFQIYNETVVDLTRMLIRVSINDLYVIQTIMSKSLTEIMEVSAFWANYSSERSLKSK